MLARTSQMTNIPSPEGEGPGPNYALTYFDNLLGRLPVMPTRVCILAPGKNAMDESAYDKITADFIIAINYGLAVPISRAKNVWVVTDCRCRFTPWFKVSNSIFDGIRVFSTPVCAWNIPVPHPYPHEKFFPIKLHPETLEGNGVLHPFPNHPPYTPLDGVFRPDVTVAGTALRLAELCGVKYIELCGVDMGKRYFDKSARNPNLPDEVGTDPLWSRLDSQVAYLQKKIDIVTLSSSALSNPRRVDGVPDRKREGIT